MAQRASIWQSKVRDAIYDQTKAEIPAGTTMIMKASAPGEKGAPVCFCILTALYWRLGHPSPNSVNMIRMFPQHAFRRYLTCLCQESTPGNLMGFREHNRRPHGTVNVNNSEPGVLMPGLLVHVHEKPH